MVNKLFYGVEDIYVADNRREIIEALKPMITGGDGLEIEKKGVDQITADVCGNFMFNSNHKDAVRKTQNDRRFAVFYSAQQEAGDLATYGMSGRYFPDIYTWLKNEGYAIVADYLEAYDIPAEFNPAGDCHRAPVTSSTSEALSASMGGIEQEIMEAVEEGRPGFAGGWISSVAIERLLHNMHATRAIPPNKRRDLLISIGYDWHPALKGGRVNNAIAMDEGKKPRLFIPKGHINGNIQGPAEVARLYQEAQGAQSTSVSEAATVFK